MRAIPAAIVIARLLIAAAIVFTFRWEISSSQVGVLRIDRWNGRISVCNAAACYEIPK